SWKAIVALSSLPPLLPLPSPPPFALPPSLEGVPVAHAESTNTANKVKPILFKNLFMCIRPLFFYKIVKSLFFKIKNYFHDAIYYDSFSENGCFLHLFIFNHLLFII